GAVQRQGLLPAADLGDQDLAGLDLHVHPVRELELHLALRALDVDRLGVPVHLDARRDRDRHFSYSRGHGPLLPDAAEVLATESLVARFDVGHDAAGRGHDGGAHAALHLRNGVPAQVDAASGLAHALDPLDDALLLGVILEIDADQALLLVVDRLVIVDELLLEQQPHQLRLHVRSRNVHLLVLRLAGVADARQEIRDGIANRHGSPLVPGERPELPARLDHARDLAQKGELPEANAADAEVAKEGPRPAAAMAT